MCQVLHNKFLDILQHFWNLIMNLEIMLQEYISNKLMSSISCDSPDGGVVSSDPAWEGFSSNFLLSSSNIFFILPNGSFASVLLLSSTKKIKGNFYARKKETESADYFSLLNTGSMTLIKYPQCNRATYLPQTDDMVHCLWVRIMRAWFSLFCPQKSVGMYKHKTVRMRMTLFLLKSVECSGRVVHHLARAERVTK